MGLRDFVDRYIVSVPGSAPKPEGEFDTAQVPLEATTKMSSITVEVEESGVKAAVTDASFDKIFEAARITVPAHKFTVEKVGDMLNHPKLKALPVEGKAAAVLVALEAQGVKIESVIEEAARKDKALDIFEKVRRDRFRQFAAQKEGENRKLAAQMEANMKAVSAMEADVEEWVAKKAAKENELFDVIELFTTDNPVSLAAPRPSASVKVTDLTQSLTPDPAPEG